MDSPPELSRGKWFTSYSGFDSALYRNREAEWLFPQEEATFHDASDVNK
jgi:hypothetical protein